MREQGVSLFVTSGWDSTFMLCKLSRQPILITPLYILNNKRDSREYELKRIKKIIRLLAKHPDTKAKISPVKIIYLDKVQIDPDIAKARKNLKKRIGSLGYQYEYLATIAKDAKLVGVGIEKSPPEGDTGETAILEQLTELVPGKYGPIIDKNKTDPDVNIVFGNMFFPIADITELEMYDWVKENNYGEIMKQTWFCHSPINNKPCGLCRPCEEKMGSGMDFLLPEEAKNRYYKAKKLSLLGEALSRPIKRRKIKRLQSVATSA